MTSTFSSQSGSVGFKTQTSKGTFVLPSAGVFMKLQGGSLGGARELLVPDAEIGGGRDVVDAYLGPVRFEGEYDAYARMNSLATLLYGALGSKTDTTVSGSGADLVGSHLYTPIDIGNLPWLSVEENIAGTYEYFQYTDAKVNSLHLEAAADGFLTCKAKMVALTARSVQASATTMYGTSTSAAVGWDNSNMIVGTNITVSWDGNALPAKSFKFDLENNLEVNDFRLGSLTLGDAGEKRREASCGVTIRPSDSLMWHQAMFGDSAATTPGGTITRKQVVITASTYEVIGASTTVYSLSITAPQAVIKPFAVVPHGEDVLQHDLEIQFIRPNPATPLFTATVINNLATTK